MAASRAPQCGTKPAASELAVWWRPDVGPIKWNVCFFAAATLRHGPFVGLLDLSARGYFGSCGVWFRIVCCRCCGGSCSNFIEQMQELMEKMKVCLAYGVLQRSSFHVFKCAPFLGP